MDIKIVAVDMDGTFLNDQMEYDREWFQRLYQKMKQQGVEFVVASGNQYYQLRSFFEEIQDEITFVAENGAMIVEKGTCTFHGAIAPADVKKVLAVLEKYPEIETVVCGVESAYVLDSASMELYNMMHKFYHRLKQVPNYDVIEDTIFKFALTVPAGKEYFYDAILKEELTGIVVPTTSGHRSIDLIIPSLHKASGLAKLVEKWGVKKEQCVAFGDGDNDLEMLQYCGYGYAMENASERVKAVCQLHTKTNNEAGVLRILESILVDD